MAPLWRKRTKSVHSTVDAGALERRAGGTQLVERVGVGKLLDLLLDPQRRLAQCLTQQIFIFGEEVAGRHLIGSQERVETGDNLVQVCTVDRGRLGRFRGGRHQCGTDGHLQGRTNGSQRVGYRLSGQKLQYLSWPVLDRAPSTELQSVTLAEDIQTLRIRCLSRDRRWLERWPESAISNELPRALEVTVTLKNGTSLVRLFPLGAS